MAPVRMFSFRGARLLNTALLFSVSVFCGVVVGSLLHILYQYAPCKSASDDAHKVISESASKADGNDSLQRQQSQEEGRRIAWHCQWQNGGARKSGASQPVWYKDILSDAQPSMPASRVPTESASRHQGSNEPEQGAEGHLDQSSDGAAVFAILTDKASVDDRVMNGAVLSWASVLLHRRLAKAMPGEYTLAHSADHDMHHLIVMCQTCTSIPSASDEVKSNIHWLVGASASSPDALFGAAVRQTGTGSAGWLVIVEDSSFVNVPQLLHYIGRSVAMQHAIAVRSPEIACPCMQEHCMPCSADDIAALVVPMHLAQRYTAKSQHASSSPSDSYQQGGNAAAAAGIADLSRQLQEVLDVRKCPAAEDRHTKGGARRSSGLCHRIAHILDRNYWSQPQSGFQTAMVTCLTHSEQYKHLLHEMLRDWASRLYFRIESLRMQLKEQEVMLHLNANESAAVGSQPLLAKNIAVFSRMRDSCSGDGKPLLSPTPQYGEIVEQLRHATWSMNDRSALRQMYLFSSTHSSLPFQYHTELDENNIVNGGELVGKLVRQRTRKHNPKLKVKGRILDAHVRTCPSYGTEYRLTIQLSTVILDGTRSYMLQRRLGDYMLVPSHGVPYRRSTVAILPISMAGHRFQAFLAMYERTVLRQDVHHVKLVVVLMSTDDSVHQAVSADIIAMKQRYPSADVLFDFRPETFRRGRCLHYAVLQQDPGDILFFCDVDITFSAGFLQRCVHNAEPGLQVYSPIPFALYDPVFVQRARKYGLRRDSFDNAALGMTDEQVHEVIDDMMRSGWPTGHFPHGGGGGGANSTSEYRHQYIVENGLMVDAEYGHWLEHSYGMLCLYQQDYMNAGGFDLSIAGWGGEDVDLAERLVARAGLDLFRSPDPELFHRWHPKHCDPEALDEHQYLMCTASREESIASLQQLIIVHYGL
ncbi:uncharacterized protein LOC135817569 isoform X1 [Sycon ciliatum]|uniref:uncharacterized protein LOC135817569 isoform X1 n=2 Tax=Sycon ciliatum TaxID=27933 RepID=UPI0031F6CB0F